MWRQYLLVLALLLVTALAPASCRSVARPALLQHAGRLRGGQGGAQPSTAIDDATPSVEQIDKEFELEQILEEAGNRLVVVDFYAEWCGPCKQIAPFVESLAKKAAGKVMFCKVNVELAPDLTAAREVRSMPTFLLFKNGELIKTIVGADKQALREQVSLAMKPPLLRVLTSERLVIAMALAYLVTPWQRVLRA